MVCVIDLGSFSFARFNVTFEDAVKNERSAPPSALYIITGSMVLSIWKYRMFVSCDSGAVLRASPSAGRVSFSHSVADSGRFVICTLVFALCARL